MAITAPVVLSLIAVMIGTIPPASAAPRQADDPAGHRQALLTELDQTSGGKARVATKPETGTVTFLGGAPDAPLTRDQSWDHGAAARSFVDHYGSLYGVADPGTELVENRRFPSPDGGTAVRFRQELNGVPLVGAEIAVQVAADGRVLSSLGDTVPAPSTDTAPSVTPEAATATARTVVQRGSAAGDTVTSTSPELWVYDPVLLDAGGPRGARLVWRLEVSDSERRELVLVDAHTNVIALHFDQNAEAKNRSVCDRQNVVGSAQTCSSGQVRVEGGPATGISDVDNAYAYAGSTFDFYFSQFGRDSLNGAGMPLVSTVRYCPSASQGSCPYKNAFWNGSQMVYGNGFANADDVVGHELTHGVTQFTSQLFYFSQSGALNEAMSDIMGELVDLGNGLGNDTPQVRWLQGEDLPLAGINGTGALRNMADPPSSLTPQPDRMTSPNFYGGHDDNVGVHRNSGVASKAAVLISDGGTFNGQTIAGIGTTKAARIFYQVETAFLGPSSVYADLGNALPQACTNLIGTIGITAGDCTNVSKAVIATEMASAPVTPGSTLPAAPVCPAGQGATDIFTDNMENPGSGNWSSIPLSGVPWQYDTEFPASPSKSLLGPDLPIAGNLPMQRTGSFVPQVGKTTFLRFNHAYQFDYDPGGTYDGGMIEYSTNGGGSWNDAAGLITDNGYTGAITTGFGNPQQGRSAFVRNSPGYQSTRLNLSSLAGSNVIFRFLVASDSSVGEYGWFIDDVRVYTCAATGPPSAPLNVSATPMNASAFVQWQVPSSSGGSPITSYRITASPGGATMDVSAPTTQGIFNGLTNGTPYSFSVMAKNSSGFGPPGVSNTVTPSTGPGYQSITPVRVLDSRDGTGSVGKWQPGQTKNVTVAGVGGIPANATAVAMNVTVTGPSAASHLIVWPAGVAQPTASNLNFSAGQTIPNLVKVKVGSGGQVSIFNNAGTVDVIGDAVGYYIDGSGDALTSLTPSRVLDSRDGTGTTSTPWSAAQTRDVQVTGVAGSGVPASGVSAVVLNVTATGASANSHLTVWPADQAMPIASNLNFPSGRTIANLVVAKVSADGKVKIFNNAGNVNVLADVVGYFSAQPSGGRFTAITPARLLDSRDGTGGFNSPWTAGLTRTLQVSGRGGVPPAGATAVVLNVTAVFPTTGSHLTVWDTGVAMPTASNLNFSNGDVIPNLVVVKLGTGGAVNIFNNAGSVNVLADVVGYYS